jgi:hypothetical protein
MRETSGQRKARAPFGGGLWLEAHHYDQQEVDDGGGDDRAKNHFGIVRHTVSRKDPACAGSVV